MTAAIDKAPAVVTTADSSVLVASLLDGHTVHREALRALERALDEGDLVMAMPALIETYSVLTRLPAPVRMRPQIALDILARSFGDLRVLAVPADRAWGHLGEWAASEIAGGAVYDALILACCANGAAARLLTFNRRHFERMAPPELEILVPS